MNPKKTIIITCSATLFVLVGFLVFSNLNQSEPAFDPVPEIKNAAIDSIKDTNSNISEESIIITHMSSRYARADLINTEISFYLVKTTDGWNSVIVSDEPVYCERVQSIGFPSNFVDDCVLQFPRAISVDDYVNLDDSSADDEFTIIANITDSQDPFCDCLTVESGGETITLSYPDNTDIFETGETVVLTLEDGEITEVVSIDDEESDSNDDNNNYNVYVSPDPETSDLNDQTNLIFRDVDNSLKPIQIITD
jgi:hypothetical protein